MINVKKIISHPKTQFEIIDNLVKKEQELIEALHIMQSVIDSPEEIEFHTKRIKAFLKNYE